MLRTNIKKTTLHIVLPLLSIVSFALPSHAGVLFEETFDTQANWNATGSLNKDCGTPSCSDAPPNWNNYYSVPPVGSLASTIQSIPGQLNDHTGGTAKKAFVAYYTNVKYSGGSELSKTLPQDYQELYMRVWIRTQPGWQNAPDSSIKLFRMGHWDRTGSAFQYFPGGYGAPMGLFNWGTSSQWRGTDGCYIPLLRCDPQDSSYYCPQPPYDIDTPQRITAGVSPTAPGGYGDGNWHRYDLHLKMNTQTGSTWNKDGVYEFRYDGVLVRSITDLQWRYPGSNLGVGWNTIQIGGNSDNVYGGSSSAEWVAFDDLVVSTTPIPDDYVIGKGTITEPTVEPVVPPATNLPLDTSAPAVSMTSPANNATVSGNFVISANATDNVSVAGVEYYINGGLSFTSTTAPYNFNAVTTAADDGTYTLFAKAYDAAGNLGQSTPIQITIKNSTDKTITVADTTAPTVSISSPANSSTVSGAVTVAASAADNIGVSKVEFYVNNILKSTDTTSPYSFSWNTVAQANGSYNLATKAYDVAGNMKQSTSVAVTVNNQVIDTTAPVASITSPANNSTVSGGLTISASATDNVGVSKVEFYINDVLSSTSTAAPYVFSGVTTAADNGSYTITAKAYDVAGNVGESSPVLITVKNGTSSDTIAPTVSIVSPTSSYISRSIVTIKASATDNVAVTKLELYVDGTLKLAVNSNLFTWNWNTSTYAKGSHSIMVKAYDAAGNISTASKTVSKYF